MADNKQVYGGARKAPWILKEIVIHKDPERETMALVGTPEGDRVVPLSEAKGKVDIVGQLPEPNRRAFIEYLRKAYMEWLEEQQGEGPANSFDQA